MVKGSAEMIGFSFTATAQTIKQTSKQINQKCDKNGSGQWISDMCIQTCNVVSRSTLYKQGEKSLKEKELTFFLR